MGSKLNIFTAVPVVVKRGDMLCRSAQCLGGVENSSLKSMVDVCTMDNVDAQPRCRVMSSCEKNFGTATADKMATIATAKMSSVSVKA
jgi:hypothetical protein